MKRKIMLLTSLFILFSTGIVGFVTLLSYIYSDRLDYGVDEKLFMAAVGDGATSYQVYDGNGVLFEVWRDRGLGGGDWCPLTDVNEYIKLGFISMEDREFYSHNGVNLKRTAYAFLNRFLHLGSRFGASTITQQVIKNISGDNEYTLRRKVNEIFRAYHLENRHSKDEILELYLNIVPMPGNNFGVKDGARMFFDKLPSEVSIAEAALIVGVTNSPTRYNPYHNIAAAKEKRNRVLYAMLDNGSITKEEYSEACNEEIILSGIELGNNVSSWFVETAREELLRDIMEEHTVSRSGAAFLLRGGKVVLTMDYDVQSTLEEYFENVDNLPSEAKSGLNYSMAIIDNSSGNLVAIIGNSGHKTGNLLLNYASTNITPGSVLKPLALYAPMIESGKINSASLFDDIPLYYNETDSGLVGYPKNSPDVYDGYVTVSDAVAYSKNTVAATLFNTLGVRRITENLSKNYGFKITKNDEYLAPLALGQLTNSVNIIDLTRAYAAFSNNGVIRSARSYLCALDREGKIIFEKQPLEKRIMKKDTAAIMTSLLSGVVDRGTGRSVRLKDIVDTAGKTGTSGCNLDKLFVGYTPYYTAGIWCGYADGTRGVGKLYPSHVKVWDEVMMRIHQRCINGENLKLFDYDGLLRLSFSSVTGEYSEEGDCVGYFTKDNLPHGYDNLMNEYRPANR